MTPWARGFFNVVHAIKEAHEVDQMIVSNIIVEEKAAEKIVKIREEALQEQLSYCGTLGCSYLGR